MITISTAKIKDRAKRFVTVAIAVAMCASVIILPRPAQPVSAVGNAATQKYQEQIQQLKQDQQALLEKINNLKSEASSTREYKQYLDSLINTVNLKIQASEGLIEELDNQIAETQAAIEEHEELIEKASERVKERMRQNHEDGKVNYLNVLIGAEGVGDFLARLERINTLLEYDEKTLNEYRDEKAKLEEDKAELEKSKKLQESTLESLKTDKADSESLANQAASYLQTLSANTEAANAEYNQIKAKEEQLDAELQKMLAEISKSNSSQVVSDGNFMWPLPAGGYISCQYGGYDPGGRIHYAVDCAIAYGTPIYASNDGTVVTAAWHDSYGNYVVIDHGNGLSTLYAHCSSLAVSCGQQVAKGQVIAYVGSSGYSTGNHLHFQFMENGVKVNPMNYVSK